MNGGYIEDVINDFIVEEYTINSLTDLEDTASAGELMDYLEFNFPDAAYFMDEDLQAALENLADSGITWNEMLRFNNSNMLERYSHYIDIYYITNLDCYIVEFFAMR